MTDNLAFPSQIDRARTVRELSRRLEKMEAATRPGSGNEALSTGILPLDCLLPGGGFQDGTLVEWLADSAASGVDLLALLSARPLLREGRVLVVLDREKTFYPPAAAAWGMQLQQTVVVRPANSTEELWALEQCLQSAGVAVTWCRLARATSQQLRRLQLAVERGRGLGFLLRPLSARGQPAWSDVRLLVTSLVSPSSNRRWNVELVRSRRGTGKQSVILEFNDATGDVSSVAELAPAASRTRAARA